jgi:hypothetical protein
MKRTRVEERAVYREEKEEEEEEGTGDELGDGDSDAVGEEDDELLEEARAVGIIGKGSAGEGVDAKGALREAYRSFAQDLPWIERLEVVSAEPLGAVDARDDLKLELALCVLPLSCASIFFAARPFLTSASRNSQHNIRQ